MPRQFSVTLAICTYNRAASLQQTLGSVLPQIAAAENWNLLIVTNNCSDHTAGVLRRLRQRFEFRCIDESEQGLAACRNAAMRQSDSDYVAFCDDDISIGDHFVGAYQEMLCRYPDADFWGGRIKPRWIGGRPAWARDENMSLLSGLFGNYDLGESVRPYTKDDALPYGANFGVSRKLVSAIGGFDTRFGVKGDIPGRSEETEFLERASAAGAKGVYVGRATAFHRIRGDRFTVAYLYAYGKEKGKSLAMLRDSATVRGMGSRRFWLMSVLRGVYQLARGRGDRARQCLINAGISAGIMESGVGHCP